MPQVMARQRKGLMRLGWAICLCLASVSAVAGVIDARPAEALYVECSWCHGPAAEGIEARRGPKLSGLQPWYLEMQLRKYKAGVRGDHPQDLYGAEMILFARRLFSDEEIGQVAGYIAALPDVPVKETVTGNARRGARLYERCAVCHGAEGEGKVKYRAPRLIGMNDWYLASQLRNFVVGAVGYSEGDRAGRQMARAAKMQLHDDVAIDDVVSYINQLKKKGADIRGSQAAPPG